MRRLRQLALQFDAPMTFLDPRVAQELELSAEQRQGIDRAIQAHMPRPPRPGNGQGGPGQGGPGQGGPGQGGPRPTFAQMQAAKAAAFEQAWSLLSAAQKAEWREMVGAAFTQWEDPGQP